MFSLQSAYRPCHSTETALLTVQDAFLRAIDSHQAIFLIMVDLSAAFDTVDHNILLQRLTCDFGLDGVVHQWFHTYLSDRSSQVCVKDALSTEAKLKYGVPQGSVIGPQMFTYYSHTIGQLIRRHSIQYHMYADDVQLFLTFNPSRPGDAACALFRLSRCVNELQSWLVTNKLKMNPDKMAFFIAASPTHLKNLDHLTFNLNGTQIHPSPSVRNLGVVFDRNMSMSAHITQLCRSLNWHIRNLSRIRRFLDFSACHNAVRALILSKLDYGCCLLNGVSQKDVSRLQRLQNRCARLIFQLPKFTHSSPLLKQLHWLPVAQRIQFRTMVHTYKSLNHCAPDYLSSLLSLQTSSYSLRSTTGKSLSVHKTHKLAGDRAFSIAAPRLWNSLPTLTRSSNSVPAFKRALKTHLFASS